MRVRAVAKLGPALAYFVAISFASSSTALRAEDLQPHLWRDFAPGENGQADSDPRNLVQLPEGTWFTARTREFGREAWVIPTGTEVPQLLADLCPGECDGARLRRPRGCRRCARALRRHRVVLVLLAGQSRAGGESPRRHREQRALLGFRRSAREPRVAADRERHDDRRPARLRHLPRPVHELRRPHLLPRKPPSRAGAAPRRHRRMPACVALF